MHELSLAEALLPVVLATAAEHDAGRVTAVGLRAGVLQQIVPDSLRTAFAAVAVGTIAEGATVTIDVEPVVARCRRCGGTFTVEEYVFLCPDCGLADVETIAGCDLLLCSVELEPCASTSSTT